MAFVKPIKYLTALFALSLAACQEPPAAQSAMQPAAVTITQVSTQDTPFTLTLPATLVGSKEVEVRARVAGILQSRNFKEGDRVTKGQSLFTLELTPFELAVTKAKAALASSKATYANAERELTRLKQLRQEKSVSERDLDTATANYEVAEAMLAASQAQLAEAELNYQYAKVTSPVAGIVGREFVSEGTYVTGPDMLLTQITQLDPIELRFGLAEREQLALRQEVKQNRLTLPEQGHWQATIILPDGSRHPLTGEVNFQDIRVNPYTGTSELQAVIPNPEFSLRPGQFVRVVLSGATRKNAIVLPQKAVLDNGLGKFVYLAVKNEQGMLIAKPQPIEVAEWVSQEGQTNWVITKGLNPGDPVVTEGMARIFFPGMPIAAQ